MKTKFRDTTCPLYSTCSSLGYINDDGCTIECKQTSLNMLDANTNKPTNKEIIEALNWIKCDLKALNQDYDKSAIKEEVNKIEAYIQTQEQELTNKNKELAEIKEESEIEYKGYKTIVRYSHADKLLCGKIENTTDLVYFESENANEIESKFQEAVDEYIKFKALCEETE